MIEGEEEVHGMWMGRTVTDGVPHGERPLASSDEHSAGRA